MAYLKDPVKAEAAYRVWETTILDVAHTLHPFWVRSRGEALLSLLAGNDCMAVVETVVAQRQFESGTVGFDPAQAQKLKSFEEGFCQACRWVMTKDDDTAPIRGSLSADLIQQAMEFTFSAAEYVDIADMHIARERGLLDIAVDAGARIVRFVPRQTPGGFSAMTGMQEQVLAASGYARSFVYGPTTDAFDSVGMAMNNTPVRVVNGHIEIVDFNSLWTPEVLQASRRILPEDLPELKSIESLGDFTIGDLDAVWAAWRAWAWCLMHHFLRLAGSGRRQETVLPTQLHPTADLIDRLAAGSLRSASIVRSIIKTLTLDNRTARPDITQQPVVVFGNDCAWSPRFIGRSRYLRNTLKLLARGGQSDLVANLMGTVEGPMLRSIGERLAKSGYSWKKNVPINAAKERGDIDLLAWNSRFPKQVLVVEAKGVLPPDEVNEIAGATKSALHAQSQLARVFRILKNMDEHARIQKFPFVPWQEVPTCFGLVVLYDGAPSNIYSHTTLPCVSVPVLKGLLRSSDFQSPLRIVEACKQKRWLEGTEVLDEWEKRTIGGITYELPMLAYSRGD